MTEIRWVKTCSSELARKINEALDVDCLHGLTVTKRDGADMPVKAWDCYGCTASIVSELIDRAALDAVREAAKIVCEECAAGVPLVEVPRGYNHPHTDKGGQVFHVGCEAGDVFLRWPLAVLPVSSVEAQVAR